MQKFIFTLIFLSNIVFAIDKVFFREYTYKASDYDSKVTARVNALNQVSELLLREVGVYIKSETKWDKKEINYEIEEIYEKKMDVITAGITRVEIIDEKWNWGEYWVKAKVTLNPKDIKKKIDDLVKNKEKFDQHEQLKKENNKANKEIERLRKELANVKSEKEQLELSKSYNKEVDKLSSLDWFYKAYETLKNGNIEKSILFYITAIELNPESLHANFNLGWIYMTQGKIDQAHTYLLKALEIESEYIDTYYNLASKGKNSQAETYSLEKTIQLDPEQGGGVDVYIYLSYLSNHPLFYRKKAFKYAKKAGPLGCENAQRFLKDIENAKKVARLGDENAQEWLKDFGHTW